jgi:hypothetical protein
MFKLVDQDWSLANTKSSIKKKELAHGLPEPLHLFKENGLMTD